MFQNIIFAIVRINLNYCRKTSSLNTINRAIAVFPFKCPFPLKTKKVVSDFFLNQFLPLCYRYCLDLLQINCQFFKTILKLQHLCQIFKNFIRVSLSRNTKEDISVSVVRVYSKLLNRQTRMHLYTTDRRECIYLWH